MPSGQVRRLFCVYETPEPEFPSHADILLTASNFQSNNARKKQAFDFGASISPLFVRAEDYKEADLVGIKYQGAISQW
jgi:hypothetical protein